MVHEKRVNLWAVRKVLSTEKETVPGLALEGSRGQEGRDKKLWNILWSTSISWWTSTNWNSRSSQVPLRASPTWTQLQKLHYNHYIQSAQWQNSSGILSSTDSETPGAWAPWPRLHKPQVVSQLKGWSPMELPGHQTPTKWGLSLPSTMGPMQPCGLSRRTKVEKFALNLTQVRQTWDTKTYSLLGAQTQERLAWENIFLCSTYKCMFDI